MFDEHRLRNYGTNAARPRESSKSNDEMNEKDDKITHLGIVSNLKLLGLPAHCVIRQEQVALHHSGKKQMQQLGGPAGTYYEANEGISILRIKDASKG